MPPRRCDQKSSTGLIRVSRCGCSSHPPCPIPCRQLSYFTSPFNLCTLIPQIQHNPHLMPAQCRSFSYSITTSLFTDPRSQVKKFVPFHTSMTRIPLGCSSDQRRNAIVDEKDQDERSFVLPRVAVRLVTMPRDAPPSVLFVFQPLTAHDTSGTSPVAFP